MKVPRSPTWYFNIPYDQEHSKNEERAQEYKDAVKAFKETHDKYFNRAAMSVYQLNHENPDSPRRQREMWMSQIDMDQVVQKIQSSNQIKVCRVDLCEIHFNLLDLIRTRDVQKLHTLLKKLKQKYVQTHQQAVVIRGVNQKCRERQKQLGRADSINRQAMKACQLIIYALTYDVLPMPNFFLKQPKQLPPRQLDLLKLMHATQGPLQGFLSSSV